jgi:hypothetical protein
MFSSRRLIAGVAAAAMAIAVVPMTAFAQPAKEKEGDKPWTWPEHYDFFVPYGYDDGGPGYSKPGYKGMDPKLSCFEASALLLRKGYRLVDRKDCSSDTYMFTASREGERGTYLIEMDPLTGNIVKRDQQ